MKEIIPQNDYVLCIKTTDNKKSLASGFTYESKDDISLYKVVAIGCNVKDDNLSLKIGDIIRTNSIGTKAILDDVEYMLFKVENIMGKII